MRDMLSLPWPHDDETVFKFKFSSDGIMATKRGSINFCSVDGSIYRRRRFIER